MRYILILLSCLVFIPLSADGLRVHKFYYSRTSMQPSRMGHTLEIEMRFFTDDLENAIATEDDGIYLGTDRESNQANFKIEDYIRNHFGFYLNDQYVDYRFYGKEVEFDITYCYLECSLPRDVNSFEVQNTMLMELFYEQVNEIDVTLNGIRKRLLLTYEQPAQLITF